MGKVVKFFHKYKLCLITYVVIAAVSVILNTVTVVLCCAAAYAERGYDAIGGEWVLASVLSYVEWRWVTHTAKSWWKGIKGV